MKLRRKDWQEAQEFIFFQSETQNNNSINKEENEENQIV